MSPVVQDARPGQRGGGPGDQVVAVGRRRSPAARARWRRPVSPPMSASAARYISTDAGTRASSSWSTTTRSAAGRRQQVFDVTQTLVDAVELVAGHQPADERDREHGPVAHDVVGQLVDPAPDDVLAPLATQRRDGQLDEVGGAVDVAGGEGMPDRGLRSAPARRTSRQPGDAARRRHRVAPRAGVRGARRRTGGGSGTSVGGRRAGSRNRFARSRASSMALPLLPSGRGQTASQSGPVSRSRTEVSSRKRRTSSGCRLRTSSAR